MLLNCGAAEDSRESLNCKEIKQSVLNEINLEHSLEGMTLKLMLQCFGRLMRR